VQRIPPYVMPPALASLDRPGGTPYGFIADLGVRPKIQPMSESKPILISPAIGKGGMTELHYAAYCEDLNAVDKCLAAGADVNAKDDCGYTALAWCIDMAATSEIGEAEAIIDRLIERGASLEFSDARYESILDLALASDQSVADHIKGILERAA